MRVPRVNVPHFSVTLQVLSVRVTMRVPRVSMTLHVPRMNLNLLRVIVTLRADVRSAYAFRDKRDGI